MHFDNTTQPKEPQINLPDKFDDTCSKFQGFVNQMHLIIWLHFHQCPTKPTQIRLIGTLLSSMALTWFAPLLEHQSPLLNNFEKFHEKFHEKLNATFGNSNKEHRSNIKI